jgi:hypothetical protein
MEPLSALHSCPHHFDHCLVFTLTKKKGGGAPVRHLSADAKRLPLTPTGRDFNFSTRSIRQICLRFLPSPMANHTRTPNNKGAVPANAGDCKCNCLKHCLERTFKRMPSPLQCTALCMEAVRLIEGKGPLWMLGSPFHAHAAFACFLRVLWSLLISLSNEQSELSEQMSLPSSI